MNRCVLPLIVGSLVLPLGCGGNDDRTDPNAALGLQPGELCSDRSDAAIATFDDPMLEEVIRAALSVGPQDDLTCGLVSGLTDLEAQNAGIESLVGIQNLTGLTNLNLDSNSITDISTLSGLTDLTELELGSNSITDISALSSLTSLTYIDLWNTSTTDVSALSGLTRLTNLDLTHNSISDISVLSGMTGMETLPLYNNPITDPGCREHGGSCPGLWAWSSRRQGLGEG